MNGQGSILLTRECLLSKVQQRNPGVNKLNLESVHSLSFFGVSVEPLMKIMFSMIVVIMIARMLLATSD